MSALSSDAILLKYRKRSVVDTISNMYSQPAIIETHERNAFECGLTSLPAQGHTKVFEEFSKRECDSPLLTSLSHSGVHFDQTLAQSFVDGVEDRQSLTIDWDKVNHETEKKVTKSMDVNIDSGVEENQSTGGFLKTILALKNDTFSWTPYVSLDRFTVKNKGSCFMLLLRRCVLSFYSRIFFFSGGGVDDDDAEYALQQDAEFSLTLPFVPFDHSQNIHCELLLAIHDGLLGETDRTGENGGHFFAINWEKLGFQGSDPSTDLRSTGIFGLVQLFYLVEYYEEFALRLWKMCTRDSSDVNMYEELPFVLIGFNFSAFLLDSLKNEKFYADIMRWTLSTRSKKITTECRYLKNNDEQLLWRDFPVLSACCEYYVGCLFLFFECWLRLKAQRDGKSPTIGDFGVVKAKLCTKIKKSGAQFVFDACASAKEPSILLSFDVELSMAPVRDCGK